MKKLTIATLLLSAAALVFTGCTKSGNYSSTDHTVGLVSSSKHFKGYAQGFYKGDTLLHSGDTTHSAWAKYYYRVIADTTISIQKVNGFLINAMDLPLPYRSTDSLTSKVVRFDTTISGSPVSFLDFYYATGSITLEYHHIGALNTLENQYYQDNIVLHTY